MSNHRRIKIVAARLAIAAGKNNCAIFQRRAISRFITVMGDIKCMRRARAAAMSSAVVCLRPYDGKKLVLISLIFSGENKDRYLINVWVILIMSQPLVLQISKVTVGSIL